MIGVVVRRYAETFVEASLNPALVTLEVSGPRKVRPVKTKAQYVTCLWWGSFADAGAKRLRV